MARYLLHFERIDAGLSLSPQWKRSLRRPTDGRTVLLSRRRGANRRRQPRSGIEQDELDASAGQTCRAGAEVTLCSRSVFLFFTEVPGVPLLMESE